VDRTRHPGVRQRAAHALEDGRRHLKNAGPRVSAAFDLTGDGKTALKGSAARYYYIIPTTGTPLDNVNPNFTYQALLYVERQ
jgi:hypothetical protein